MKQFHKQNENEHETRKISEKKKQPFVRTSTFELFRAKRNALPLLFASMKSDWEKTSYDTQTPMRTARKRKDIFPIFENAKIKRFDLYDNFPTMSGTNPIIAILLKLYIKKNRPPRTKGQTLLSALRNVTAAILTYLSLSSVGVNLGCEGEGNT